MIKEKIVSLRQWYSQCKASVRNWQLKEKASHQALEWIACKGMDKFGKDAIQYGLEHSLFTQEEVDVAQTKYMENSARKALDWVCISGINHLSSADKKNLEYGLEHGLFTQKEIDAKQKQYECAVIAAINA